MSTTQKILAGIICVVAFFLAPYPETRADKADKEFSARLRTIFERCQNEHGPGKAAGECAGRRVAYFAMVEWRPPKKSMLAELGHAIAGLRGLAGIGFILWGTVKAVRAPDSSGASENVRLVAVPALGAVGAWLVRYAALFFLAT